MSQSETLLQKEPVKEPAKRWRNWWRSLVNDTWASGETGPLQGQRTWPSRDAAETAAEASTYFKNWRGKVEYLGAFPEGETPNG